MKSLDVDATRQEELYHKACSRMARLIPGWSDEFPSDPAVAVLELASYLSDIQNHALDQVREEHFLAYLKLLGEAPRPLAPARLLAQPPARGRLFPGTRFWIDGVPFEVADTWRDSNNRVTEVVPEGSASPVSCDRSEGLGFLIAFRHPLPAGKPARLWLELQPEPGRVPPDEETPPPVRLRAWTREGGQWREASCRDSTCGLLQSGYLDLTPSAASRAVHLLAEGEVEGGPQLSAAVLEPVILEQRRTRSRCVELAPPFQLPEGWTEARTLRFFLPEGAGWRESGALPIQNGRVTPRREAPPMIRVVAAEADFPAEHTLRGIAMERIALDEEGVLPQSLRLMTEEDGLWYDCPAGEPEAGRTLPRGCRWDAEKRALCFGDGRDFRIPRPGQLLIAGCACTLGSAGNGAGGTLERDGSCLPVIAPAAGGQDAERAKDAFLRAAREQSEPLRAVTCEDYERLARRAPGLALDRVRAVTDRTLGGPGAGVTVVAKPRADGARPALTPWQEKRLRQWLEPLRLLGVPLTVKGPRYCALSVRVRIQTGEEVDPQQLRDAALSLTDGVTGPLDFGSEVSYTALFSALGAVPGVRRVRSLELDALGQGGRRVQEGGIRLEADVLPCLECFQVTEE